MRLGIFGGTFDPPHIGHLVLASEARHQLDLDLILWVLTLNPPHKQSQSITSLFHRLDMVRAAIGTNPNFKLSRVDIDRSPPHYAVDTLKLISKEYPYADLVYLMGSDSLENLDTWYKPKEFVKLCKIIGVMSRPGSIFDSNKLEMLIPEMERKVRFIETPLLAISASQIRNRISKNRPFRYYLPPQVFRIIRDRNLYLTN
jgi:nicotinate-nucleotide adenylyltransferase